MTTASVYRTLRILEAAKLELAERGFDDVTLRAIATRAHVSPPLVLHHYGTKLGVVRALYDEQVTRVVQWTARLGRAPFARRFVRFVRQLLRELLPVRSALPLLLALPPPQDHRSVRKALEQVTAGATDTTRVATVDAARFVHVDRGFLLLAEIAVDRLLRRWHVTEDTDAMETVGARVGALLDEVIEHGTDFEVLARLDASLSVPAAQPHGRMVVPRVSAPRIRARPDGENSCDSPR